MAMVCLSPTYMTEYMTYLAANHLLAAPRHAVMRQIVHQLCYSPSTH